MPNLPAKAFARTMRKAPSFHETQLWKLLRDRRLGALKFRRQVPIGRYVADFVCLRHRLIIETDGPLHDPDRDMVRDAWLASQGFRVLRFGNAEVSGQPGAVMAAILKAAATADGWSPAAEADDGWSQL